MQRNKFLSTLIAGTALAVLGAGVSAAHAAPAPTTPVPTTVPTTTTLPLFGVQLTVDVTTGPGGALSSVSVNPADGLTATKDKPNKVVFVNDAGTAKVVVSGHDGRQGVQVKAGALADISGDGGWSGDVFGTGTATTVSFTIGATTEGGPDITGVTSSDATAVIGATKYHDGEHGHDHQAASAKVTFSAPGQTRSLLIAVELHTGDDGTTRARSSVTLGRLHAVAQPVSDATGVKTWSGQLCSGETAGITYTVNADGTVTDVTATPTAQIATNGNHVDVRFSDNERVRIRTRLDGDNLTVSVDPRIHCHDAPDPTVNTPIVTTTTDPSQHGDDGHDHHHGGNGGGGGGNGGGDDHGGHDGGHDGHHG